MHDVSSMPVHDAFADCQSEPMALACCVACACLSKKTVEKTVYVLW